MKRLALLAICVFSLLAVASPASAHYRSVGKSCGSIQFTPQSDDGASSIYASRVTCHTARRIVRAVRRGNESPLGFDCRGRGHDPRNGLAHNDVICTRGSRRVTWAAF